MPGLQRHANCRVCNLLCLWFPFTIEVWKVYSMGQNSLLSESGRSDGHVREQASGMRGRLAGYARNRPAWRIYIRSHVNSRAVGQSFLSGVQIWEDFQKFDNLVFESRARLELTILANDRNDREKTEWNTIYTTWPIENYYAKLNSTMYIWNYLIIIL